jgi:hypothetical protein
MNGTLSTEVLLSYNWNVYKLFKNGKRAKAPLLEFECSQDNVTDYFEKEVKKNFTEKMLRAKYEIIRADMPQVREVERVEQEKEKFLRNKNRVLAALVRHYAPHLRARSVSAGLVYCAESKWKWQWAAVEPATGKYIQGLSPEFKKHADAHQWLKNHLSAPQ